MDEEFFVWQNPASVCTRYLFIQGTDYCWSPPRVYIGTFTVLHIAMLMIYQIQLILILMFADDTELHYCHGHLQRVKEVLQNELEQVSNWITVNRLKLNAN